MAMAAGLAVFSVHSVAPAFAQDGSGRGRIISIGGGVDLTPKYPGADEVGIGPLPYFDIRREGAPLTFEAPDEGIGMSLIGDAGGIAVGPTIRFQGKRQEEDVGAPVGDVGFTVEVGAFAQAFLAENIRVRAEGRKGLGGHEGWTGDLSADFVLRDRDSYVFSVGPRARWADNDYHDAYFGVTPAVAAATGLPAYDPDGGFHSVGAIAGLTRMIGRDVGVYAYAGYDRLIGDAANSPIVRTFGSRDQFSGGLALFFSFNAGGLFGN
ncbi:MAG TPA: MipA/OmpV family protein [Allosphingosinicella sp.]|nr:MipA/OmpV family protein [Allosphingosinicella sp.]